MTSGQAKSVLKHRHTHTTTHTHIYIHTHMMLKMKKTKFKIMSFSQYTRKLVPEIHTPYSTQTHADNKNDVRSESKVPDIYIHSVSKHCKTPLCHWQELCLWMKHATSQHQHIYTSSFFSEQAGYNHSYFHPKMHGKHTSLHHKPNSAPWSDSGGCSI